MKTFHVYRHPTQNYEAVKQGFCWPAFFFTVIWALVKKMWGVFSLFLGINILLGLVAAGISDDAGITNAVGGLILVFIFGIKGNDWRKRKLVNHGFEKLDIIEAKTKDAAIAGAVKQNDESVLTDSQIRWPERRGTGAGDHEEGV